MAAHRPRRETEAPRTATRRSARWTATVPPDSAIAVGVPGRRASSWGTRASIAARPTSTSAACTDASRAGVAPASSTTTAAATRSATTSPTGRVRCATAAQIPNPSGSRSSGATRTRSAAQPSSVTSTGAWCESPDLPSARHARGRSWSARPTCAGKVGAGRARRGQAPTARRASRATSPRRRNQASGASGCEAGVAPAGSPSARGAVSPRPCLVTSTWRCTSRRPGCACLPRARPAAPRS